MVKVKDTILYISREVLDKLPDPERNKFELVSSFKPTWLAECFQYLEENDHLKEIFLICYFIR